MAKGKLLGKNLGLLLNDGQGLREAFAHEVQQTGYAQYFALQEDGWRLFVSRLTEGLADFLQAPALAGKEGSKAPGQGSPDCANALTLDIPTALAREAVQLFRQDGLPFAVFFSLLKCLHRTVLNDPTLPPLPQSHSVLFFDLLETAAADCWLKEEGLAAQRRLREAKHFILNEKRRYATIFHRMAEPACIVDQQGCLLDVNAAFAEFFKEGGERLLGKSCLQLFGVQACKACLLEKNLAEHGSFANIEVNLPVADEIRTVLISGASLGRVRGVPGGIVILQDISAQRQTAQALQESEEQFRSLVENVPDVTWQADAEGTLLYLSPNIKRICGFTPTELLGRSRLDRVHPEDVEEVRKRYHRLFAKGRDFSFRYRFRHKNGKWLWVHDRARVAGTYATGVFSDVTKLRKMEDELKEYRAWLEDMVEERTQEAEAVNRQLLLEVAERQQAQQQLELLAASLKRSNAELEQFAHVASHDMKEPLLLIVAFVERLQARWPEKFDGKAGEYLARILRAARQLQELVDDILHLSKVRTCDRPFGVVELDDLLREVLGDFEERISQVEGNVCVDGLVAVVGDKTQLRQLFQNLIANALKYRQKNLSPVIAVKGRTLPGKIYEITVQDNGIGFEEKHAERIFQPFVRLHGRNEYEGTGIGLATCEKIVARHRGKITAKSTPGEGSIFIIQLPLGPS
ncbi:sensor histidine kinase [Thiovibrio frasassiensis]|uniref:histidine kinase n=1 Tax=Thiovibrio frasassiensis TaxID=2984131 RepID=A0A9X4MGT4_9BACT|nr:PAS domain S-box protein [Thiovibrio frasassiensis]MDG4476352.1 PAS domain S-box protein [Thiovibrio frasassiensis]